MSITIDLLIKNGTLVTGNGLERSGIAIKDDKIFMVGPDVENLSATEVVDASHQYILPGIIDVHTHPYYEDDFEGLSYTAAWGGTTTVIHFAYAFPGTTVVEAAEKALEAGSNGSYIDFGLHLGLFEVEKQYPLIPEVFKLGINSFKMFMTYAKLGRMTTDYYLAAIMDIIGANNGMAMVHAENGLVTDYLEDTFNARGIPAIEAFTKMRPAIMEGEAINRAIAIAELCNCALYIPHVSAKKALEPIIRAQAEGKNVYAETCPQYLELTEEDLFRWGPRVKIGPPLRTTADNAYLWEAIARGDIDTVASDHAPKGQRQDEDFFNAGYGSPQAETLLTLVYDGGVNTGKISLPKLVEVLCENPARIFGLYPKKGCLEPGSDADIVIFDPADSHTLTKETQHSNAEYTLYEGRSCLGRPVMSFQRGKKVLADGQLHAKPGFGEFLPRFG